MIEEDLEFASVRWWVPDVALSATTGAELDEIVELLDSFVEMDEVVFGEIVSSAAVTTIEVGPTDTDLEATPPQGEPLDPVLQARLMGFIEEQLGREFESVPKITVVDGAELREGVPAGTFVPEALWDVLLALELVAGDDGWVAADSVRRERVRGVCCPVVVIDTGDAAFNEVVLVHELTHFLDTDLESGGSSPDEVVDVYAALVEGNAHRVAFGYADILNRKGAAIDDPPNIFDPAGDLRLPDPVRQILEFPYDEGYRFSSDLAAAGGEEAIVDAFSSRPPSSSEQVLDIDSYLADEQPAEVPVPELPAGSDVRREGSLGAFGLLLLVEPQLGPERGRDLALTWAGDSYVLYEGDGRLCISAVVELDEAVDGRALVDSLRFADADVSRVRNTVSIENCVGGTP